MVANFEKSPNLAKLLGDRGYVSFQAGKWWEGNACRCGGFTEAMTHGDPTKGGRHGDDGLKVGREGLKPVFEFLDTVDVLYHFDPLVQLRFVIIFGRPLGWQSP